MKNYNTVIGAGALIAITGLVINQIAKEEDKKKRKLSIYLLLGGMALVFGTMGLEIARK